MATLSRPIGTCKYCGEEFIYNIDNMSHKIFCSESCRYKNWKSKNKERYLLLSKRWYRKKVQSRILVCKECNKQIPHSYRTHGRKYCSKECSTKALRKQQEKYRIRAQKALDKYKISNGCKLCGYNKCSAAIDFHHLDPSKKEKRIDAKTWYCKSEHTKKELAKCILLCSNCHKEVHNGVSNV